MQNIQVFAIRSNDEGVAYAVSAEGFNFFHAGDLNVWHWNDASERDNAYSLKIYRRQLEKISGLYYDVAMIPLDPRLGENAPRAIEEFFRNVHCRVLFPMHYWNRRAEAATYLEDDRLTPYRKQIHFERQAEI
jgi:L-ascorbate metabolism protein UlaG (beta-lactamase superfamily)